MANNVGVPIFQYGSLIVCAIIGVLLFTRWKEHRVFQWVYFAAMLSFPFEWFADNYWMYLNYNNHFLHMFGHFPLFQPFAWAWFFPLAILGLFSLERWTDKLPKVLSVVVVYLIAFAWDCLVEILACKVNLWAYWWPKGAFIPGTELPWVIPVFTAIQTVGYYYVARWARNRYEKDPDVGWFKGFAFTYGGFVLVGIANAIVGFVFVHFILQHDPTKWAPIWWRNRGFLIS